MYGFLIFIHLLVCFGLIGVVLIQSGKGGGLAGGAFGGSAQTVFGGRGATDFITRATMILGGLFFATSLTLALLSAGSGTATKSLIREEARKAASTAPPQAPGAPGGARAPQGGAPPASTPATPAPQGGQTPAPQGGTAPTPPGGGR